MVLFMACNSLFIHRRSSSIPNRGHDMITPFRLSLLHGPLVCSVRSRNIQFGCTGEIACHSTSHSR